MMEAYSRVTAKVAQLREMKCFHSAETVLSLFMSTCKMESLKSAGTELLGDIAMDKGEHKRAILIFNSLDQRPGSANVNERKYKESLCYQALGDNSAAMKVLESISAEARDGKVNLALGRMYKAESMNNQAIAAFKAVLAITPLAVEVIEALIDLGLDASDILSLTDSPAAKQEESILGEGWLRPMVTGLIHSRQGDYTRSRSSLTALSGRFPNNPFLTSRLAIAAVDAGRLDDAMTHFRAMSQLAVWEQQAQSHLALVHLIRKEEAQLSQLAHEVQSVSPQSSAGWLVIAMFCQLCNESDKAIKFANKAIALDPSNSMGFRVKGRIQLMQSLPTNARHSFIQAHNLRPSLPPVTGLIEVYLSQENSTLAMRTAKEAVARFPFNPTCHFLLGKLLLTAKEPAGNPAMAEEAFTRAIQLDIEHEPAAMHLIEIQLARGKLDAAIQSIKHRLHVAASPQLRLLYAKALAEAKQYGQAVEQLQLAISSSTKSDSEREVAKQELERMESLMRTEHAERSFEDELEEEEEEEEEDDPSGEAEYEVDVSSREGSSSSRRMKRNMAHVDFGDDEVGEGESEDEGGDDRLMMSVSGSDESFAIRSPASPPYRDRFR